MTGHMFWQRAGSGRKKKKNLVLSHVTLLLPSPFNDREVHGSDCVSALSKLSNRVVALVVAES